MQDISQNPPGAMPPLPPKDGEIARPAADPLAAKPALPVEKPAAKPQSWTPIDVSKTGVFKDKELFAKPRTSFVKNVRDDLRGTVKSFSTRDELAKKLANKRGHGLSRSEIKGAIKELRKEGKISDLKTRQLQRKFGTFKK